MATPFVPYAGPLVSRAEAKAAGLTRWFNGKQCKHGHVSQRGTATGACIACNNGYSLAFHKANPEQHNAQGKKWKDANRDQVRAAGREYSKTNRAQSKAWKDANREKVRAADKAARERNPEVYKAAVQRYLATEAGQAKRLAYYLANPESFSARNANRRALMKAAEGKHTAADIRRIGEAQGWKCHWCRKPTKAKFHVDHLVPLSKGGSNWPSNLAITCAPCNLSKRAIDPVTFAQRLGLLL